MIVRTNTHEDWRYVGVQASKVCRGRLQWRDRTLENGLSNLQLCWWRISFEIPFLGVLGYKTQLTDGT